MIYTALIPSVYLSPPLSLSHAPVGSYADKCSRAGARSGRPAWPSSRSLAPIAAYAYARRTACLLFAVCWSEPIHGPTPAPTHTDAAPPPPPDPMRTRTLPLSSTADCVSRRSRAERGRCFWLHGLASYWLQILRKGRPPQDTGSASPTGQTQPAGTGRRRGHMSRPSRAGCIRPDC